MANRYGQTDVLAQYLAAQPKQHHTGLGTALRLGGAGLAAYRQHQKQKQQKSALAAALGQILPASAEVQGMAADPLAGGGAQTQATNPQAESLATMLSNDATVPLAQAILGKALNPPKPEAFTLKPGEQRFRGGEVIAEVPAVPKPTSQPSSVLEYQHAQKNGYPGTYVDFINETRAPGVTVNTGDIGGGIAPAAGGAPTVPVPGPATNPYGGLPTDLQGKIAEKTINRGVQSLGKDEEALNTMRQTLVDFERFETLMGNQDTGGLLRKLPGAGTVEGAFDPEIQEMQSIADKVTPSMRQGLPGAASERDVRMFRGAAPGPDKLPEVNRALIQAHRIQVQNATDRLAFRQEYLAQHKTLSGADEQWNKYLDANRIFSNSDPDAPKLNPRRRTWREYFSGEGDDLSGSIGKMDLDALNQLDVNTLTPAEREAAAQRWDELNGG